MILSLIWILFGIFPPKFIVNIKVQDELGLFLFYEQTEESFEDYEITHRSVNDDCKPYLSTTALNNQQLQDNGCDNRLVNVI